MFSIRWIIFPIENPGGLEVLSLFSYRQQLLFISHVSAWPRPAKQSCIGFLTGNQMFANLQKIIINGSLLKYNEIIMFDWLHYQNKKPIAIGVGIHSTVYQFSVSYSTEILVNKAVWTSNSNYAFQKHSNREISNISLLISY